MKPYISLPSGSGNTHNYTIIFISTLQESGCLFEIDGIQKLMKGSIAAISADNLGSCSLGGFKEGSTATHGCRHCRAIPEEIATMVWC